MYVANSCVPPGFRDFPEINAGSSNPYLSCAGDGGAGFYTTGMGDCVGSTRAEGCHLYDAFAPDAYALISTCSSQCLLHVLMKFVFFWIIIYFINF